MPKILHFPYISYAGKQWTLYDIKVPNNFLKEKFPEFAVDDDVKTLYYKPGTPGKNHIKYKDGSVKDIESHDELYDLMLLRRYEIDFENKEAIKLQKHQYQFKPSVYKMVDIFKGDRAQREATKLGFEKERKIDPLTDVHLNNWLKKYKVHYLKESDWTQLPDNDLTPDEMDLWKDYRNALRGLNKTDDPLMVDLPVSPDSI